MCVWMFHYRAGGFALIFNVYILCSLHIKQAGLSHEQSAVMDWINNFLFPLLEHPPHYRVFALSWNKNSRQPLCIIEQSHQTFVLLLVTMHYTYCELKMLKYSFSF